MSRFVKILNWLALAIMAFEFFDLPRMQHPLPLRAAINFLPFLATAAALQLKPYRASVWTALLLNVLMGILAGWLLLAAARFEAAAAMAQARFAVPVLALCVLNVIGLWLHRRRAVGPGNSFKPKPLRGAAQLRR